jgi:hypothetical protein
LSGELCLGCANFDSGCFEDRFPFASGNGMSWPEGDLAAIFEALGIFEEGMAADPLVGTSK